MYQARLEGSCRVDMWPSGIQLYLGQPTWSGTVVVEEVRIQDHSSIGLLVLSYWVNIGLLSSQEHPVDIVVVVVLVVVVDVDVVVVVVLVVVVVVVLVVVVNVIVAVV